uniref:Uncharacterized protein n=1 Tax=Anguilla anguilla TaxID=7936 RepID=A0A0E9VI87_ANGAN
MYCRTIPFVGLKPVTCYQLGFLFIFSFVS